MDTRNILVGDIIFVKGSLHSLADDAIKLGEWLKDHDTEYVHVAIYIGNDQIAEAQGGRLSGIGALSQYAGNYDIGHLSLTDEQCQAIVQEAQKDYGFHYGWKRIAELAENILWDEPLPPENPHAPICTEFVEEVIKNATGIQINGETPVELSKDHRISIEKL